MKPILAVWEQEGWDGYAQEWILSQLLRLKIGTLAEIERYQVRPWSIVLRVATTIGFVFFKASAAYLEQESRLTEFLSRTQPDFVSGLLAFDFDRHWLLMRDAGVPLRSIIRSQQSVLAWKGILPGYIALQKKLSRQVPELLSLGVMDRRLARLPELFRNLLSDRAAMLLGQQDGLSAKEYEYLQGFDSQFEMVCSRLASYGIPESLHHDDFHDGNIFLNGEQVTFTDWGESAVSHPFFTMVVLLRSVENSLTLLPDASEIELVRDWYLSGWSDVAPQVELKEATVLAEQVGLINRALTWHLVISNLSDELKSKYDKAIPSYLKDFINSMETK